MVGISISRVRTAADRWRSVGGLVGPLVQVIAPLRQAVPHLVRWLAAPVVAAAARFTGTERIVDPGSAPISTATTPDGTQRDRLRQGLNLLLSIAQWAAAALIFSTALGDELFSNPASQDPLIVPAGYTFAIWAFIFPASVAYGVYQSLPQQRTNDLLRRIGWHTAFAFGCITLWSIATVFDPLRYTVPLFFGALWGLITALYRGSRHARPLTNAERAFVSVPVGVYAAWCTVGTIANTSTSLTGLGYTELLLGQSAWAVIMLLAAGVISSLMLTVSRGNIAYAAGIIWALIGIVVANVTERSSPAVAFTAMMMAAMVAFALLRALVASGERAEALGA